MLIQCHLGYVATTSQAQAEFFRTLTGLKVLLRTHGWRGRPRRARARAAGRGAHCASGHRPQFTPPPSRQNRPPSTQKAGGHSGARCPRALRPLITGEPSPQRGVWEGEKPQGPRTQEGTEGGKPGWGTCGLAPDLGPGWPSITQDRRSRQPGPRRHSRGGSPAGRWGRGPRGAPGSPGLEEWRCGRPYLGAPGSHPGALSTGEGTALPADVPLSFLKGNRIESTVCTSSRGNSGGT